MSEPRWIFVIRMIRKPGVMNAVTGVFANWGISLETAMLNAKGAEGSDGIIILSFSASERKMEILKRTVRRLSRVSELSSYSYETDELRMIAACTISSNFEPPRDPRVEIESHLRKDDTRLIYITGTVRDVDAYITPLLEEKQIGDLVRTILIA